MTAINPCAICRDDVNPVDPRSIRFSTSSPPWRVNRSSVMAAYITVLGNGFREVLRAASGTPDETYWFHRHCWDHFRDILRDTTDAGVAT